MNAFLYGALWKCVEERRESGERVRGKCRLGRGRWGGRECWEGREEEEGGGPLVAEGKGMGEKKGGVCGECLREWKEKLDGRMEGRGKWKMKDIDGEAPVDDDDDGDRMDVAAGEDKGEEKGQKRKRKNP